MKLHKADTESVITRNSLIAAQLQALPGDDPADPHTGHWWFAYERDELVGFAALVLRTEDTAYLSRAGVLPAFRGKGIQKRLIRGREAFARSRGITTLVTDTYNNPASANNLIACGFRTFMPDDPWCEDGAVYWRKHLK